MMDEEATSKKMKKSRRGRRTTKRKKEIHPEIKESLKLSDKGSYYKQDDDSVFCWELLTYFFPLLDDFIF
jgi:hypothetical protein